MLDKVSRIVQLIAIQMVHIAYNIAYFIQT